MDLFIISLLIQKPWAPVPLVFTYGAVGPSSFYKEDWGIFGLDQDTDESLEAAAGLFGVMCGENLTKEEMKNGSYLEKIKPIAAAEWVSSNPVPTVVAYGACDRVQAFLASRRLEKALKDNNVDYKPESVKLKNQISSKV